LTEKPTCATLQSHLKAYIKPAMASSKLQAILGASIFCPQIGNSFQDMGGLVCAGSFLDVVPFPGAWLWDFACKLVSEPLIHTDFH